MGNVVPFDCPWGSSVALITVLRVFVCFCYDPGKFCVPIVTFSYTGFLLKKVAGVEKLMSDLGMCILH